LENSPSVLFDAVVLPDGEACVSALARLGQAREFVINQYRHCKPMLVLGASKSMLDLCAISTQLPNGEQDPGIVMGAPGADINDTLASFLEAVSLHRHPWRELDPPPV
jgi:catalase